MYLGGMSQSPFHITGCEGVDGMFLNRQHGHMQQAPSRLEERVAYAVSALCSPYVVLPLLATAATWRVAPTPATFLLWTSVALFFLVFLPVIFVAYKVRSGQLTDIHVMVREQRAVVFLVFLGSSTVGLLLFWWLGAPIMLLILAGLVLLNGLIAMLVTFLWKISLHAWVLAGAITSFALLSQDQWIWWLLLLLPLVMWARIVRNRHSVLQSLGGAMAGIGFTAAAYCLVFSVLL